MHKKPRPQEQQRSQRAVADFANSASPFVEISHKRHKKHKMIFLWLFVPFVNSLLTTISARSKARDGARFPRQTLPEPEVYSD
jgi:hypothetical protein